MYLATCAEFWYQTCTPVIAADDHGLSTWTADGTCEFMFIFFPAVIKLLEYAAITSISHDALVTASCHNGISGPGQGVGWAWMDTDLTLCRNNKPLAIHSWSNLLQLWNKKWQNSPAPLSAETSSHLLWSQIDKANFKNFEHPMMSHQCPPPLWKVSWLSSSQPEKAKSLGSLPQEGFQEIQ